MSLSDLLSITRLFMTNYLNGIQNTSFKDYFQQIVKSKGLKLNFIAEHLGYKHQSDLTYKLKRDSFNREELYILKRLFGEEIFSELLAFKSFKERS